MISIDTELLKQMARASQTALTELQEAEQIINSITVHNDWGCKERVQINANIQKNRTVMKQLRDAGVNYTGVLTQIAGDFVTEEKGISDLFHSMEEIIGHFLSLRVPQVFRETGIVQKVIKDIENMPKGFPDFNSRINIVEFKKISESLGNNSK